MSKFKTATVQITLYEVEYVDKGSREFGKITVEIDDDFSDKEAEKYIAEKLGTGRVEIERKSLGKREITYRIPWSVFLANAEVWKIDGQAVTK